MSVHAYPACYLGFRVCIVFYDHIWGLDAHPACCQGFSGNILCYYGIGFRCLPCKLSVSGKAGPSNGPVTTVDASVVLTLLFFSD